MALNISVLFADSRFGAAMVANGYVLGIASIAKLRFLTAAASIGCYRRA